MTTVTIGTTSVASAAAAAGLAGLGLLGLGALARRRRRRRSSRGHKKPSSGGYGHRRRRSPQEVDFDEVEDESEALEAVLEAIRERDVSGCGRLLVCDLASKERADLGPEEAALLDLIGPVPLESEEFPPGAVGEYKYAKALGQAGGQCLRAFPSCLLNGPELQSTVLSYVP